MIQTSNGSKSETPGKTERKVRPWIGDAGLFRPRMRRRILTNQLCLGELTLTALSEASRLAVG
jgi:hypothetical protein